MELILWAQRMKMEIGDRADISVLENESLLLEQTAQENARLIMVKPAKSFVCSLF